MDHEIAVVINKALFNLKTLAYIQIMDAEWNVKGTITTITLQNATEEIALAYCDVISNAASTVDKAVIDVEPNELLEMLTVHAVPLMRYMGRAT